MVATIACAVVAAVTKSIVALVFNLGQKRCQLWKGFQDDIDFIKTELCMIAGVQEEQLSQKGEPNVLKSVCMEEMHDLALQIEDCLDRILRYVVEGEKESPLLHRLKAVSGPPPYAAEIKKLKERLKAAHQRKLDYSINASQPSTTAGQTTTSSMTLTFPKVEPVGIDKPKQELLQLIDDQREQLNVISIVGIGGSGKSTLARAVYDCPPVVCHFPCRAWVVASEHRGDTKGILVALLHELREGARDPARGTVQQLQTDITNYLNTKRYLIVLDDIDEQQWDSVRLSFPEKTRSRIIVTTTVQAVGKICSHGNGYVYNMGTLDMKHSKDLIETVLKGHLTGLEQSSESIVNKCDGHPLALVSVANYLVRKDVLTENECEQACRSLGYHMAKEYSFSKLRHVLMDNYSSLSCHLIKICLLYICVFPNGCFINKNRLMRRWLAEGYVKCQHPRSALQVADENFEELINRNIIRPMESSNNAKLKRCKAHGIMHEFMLHLSNSVKFITSLDNPERSCYRHLFMENNSVSSTSAVNHSSTSPTCVGMTRSENFRARSFTICGSAGEAVAEYAKCELLRVLDLEECNDLKDDHMSDIHKLWHLKYLSLGATISFLSSKIEKLHCLETLDTRKTKINTLPVEVIKLPYLAHLLGKFKLGKRDIRASEIHKFLPKESNMQTLAGFVTDSNSGFPMLMARMRKLRKVKIWCSPQDSERSLDDLSASIKKFVQDEMRTGVGVRSLSLHLGNSSVNSILHFLENSYGYLSSLKLHGSLSEQTKLVTSLHGLTELCLSSTNNLTSNDLSNLRKLKHLEYVKLVNVSLGGFIIGRRDFQRLLRLCLVQCPTLPTVEEGALPKLISLHLLCENLAGLAGIKIEQHKQIQEVALDAMASQETAAAWEDASKKHPKRPRVLFFRKICSNDPGSMVKYVATERPSHEIESSVIEEGQRPAVQPISVDELCSALKDLNVAGPSMASNELPTMMNNVMPCSSRVVS